MERESQTSLLFYKLVMVRVMGRSDRKRTKAGCMQSATKVLPHSTETAIFWNSELILSLCNVALCFLGIFSFKWPGGWGCTVAKCDLYGFLFLKINSCVNVVCQLMLLQIVV